MDAPYRILIVGAGIGGLALGRALRLKGFLPEIIERAGSWPAGGAGLYIPGNGARALKKMTGTTEGGDLRDKATIEFVRMTE